MSLVDMIVCILLVVAANVCCCFERCDAASVFCLYTGFLRQMEISLLLRMCCDALNERNRHSQQNMKGMDIEKVAMAAMQRSNS